MCVRVCVCESSEIETIFFCNQQQQEKKTKTISGGTVQKWIKAKDVNL